MTSPAKLSFNETKASVLLDLLRGLASLLVLGTHWRNLLFVDYGQVLPGVRTFFAPGYVLTSNGHRAVVIFFVLSGYLISSSIFRSLQRNTWHWGRYLLQRLARLWIVLLPGLLLGALWDRIGILLWQAPALYRGVNNDHVMQDVVVTGHLSTFLANTVFLQGPYAYVFGSNTPLWSLSNEFWYYLLFPLGLLSVMQAQGWPRRALHAAGFVLVALFVGKSLMLAFPLWLMGVLLVWLPRAPDSSLLRWGALLLLLLCFFGIPTRFAIGNDYVIGVVSTAAIWTFLGAQHRCPGNTPLARIAHQLARFSFTLYVVHMPLLTLLTSVTVHDQRWQPNAKTVLAALCMLLCTLGYAWLIAMLTEFRTDRVRRWLERSFGMQPDLPSKHALILQSSGK